MADKCSLLPASLSSDDFILTYMRLSTDGVVLDPVERRSTDLGATWPTLLAGMAATGTGCINSSAPCTTSG